MQIETSVRYHCTLAWLKIKRLVIPSVGRDVERLKLSCIASVNGEQSGPLESYLAVSYKAKHALPYDVIIPAVSILMLFICENGNFI